MVGRFINHDGGQENAPTARFGNIAQMPLKTMKYDYGRHQESYLVECRSIGGYSGSPVFVHIQDNTYRPNTNKYSEGYSGPLLLGVDWCHTVYREPLMDSAGNERRDGYVSAHSGLTGVIPSWKLLELLQGDEFAHRRLNPTPVTCWKSGERFYPEQHPTRPVSA